MIGLGRRLTCLGQLSDASHLVAPSLADHLCDREKETKGFWFAIVKRKRKGSGSLQSMFFCFHYLKMETKRKLGDADDEIVALEQPSTPAKRPKGEEENGSGIPDLSREDDSRKKDDSAEGGQREAGRNKSEEQEGNRADAPKKHKSKRTKHEEESDEDKIDDKPVSGGNTLMDFGMYAGMKYEEVIKSHYDYVRWARKAKASFKGMDLLMKFVKWSYTPEGKKYELMARGREVFPFGQHQGESFQYIADWDPDYHVRYYAKRPWCTNEVLSRYTSWFREKFGGDPIDRTYYAHWPKHLMYDSDSSS